MLSRWREGRVVCLLNRQRVGCRIAVQWVAWQRGNHKGRPYILMSAQIHPTALPSLHPSAVGSGSECVAVGFAGTDAPCMVERSDENLSVPDLSGPRSGGNGLDGTIHLFCWHRNFDAKLGQEVHGIFGAAVDFRVPLLSPVAFDFRNRHAAHSKPGERLSDFVELEWLDDRDDQLH